MKGIKWMLLGIAIMLVGIVMAIASAPDRQGLGIAGIVIGSVGFFIVLYGFFRKYDND